MNDLIERFYQVCYRDQPIVMQTVITPQTRREMLVTGIPDKSGWGEWKLVARNDGIDPRFEQFEQEIGFRFPTSFKLWNSRYYTLTGDLSFIRLPVSPPNDPFGYLRALQSSWFPERIAGIGLLPFGDMNDSGPLCFDTRTPKADADWPIVYWDHDWVGREKEISPILFSNFEKLLECCVYYWSSREEKYRDNVERSTRAHFCEIDPEGAGGPGRCYWLGTYWKT